MSIETYSGHEFEITVVPGGWKPFRTVFLDLPDEKPAFAWNEHEAREYARWFIDKVENDEAHFSADEDEGRRYEGHEDLHTEWYEEEP